MKAEKTLPEEGRRQMLKSAAALAATALISGQVAADSRPESNLPAVEKPAEDLAEHLIPVLSKPEELNASGRERESNLKIVHEYLSIKGAAAIEPRLALMADDVMYEIVNTMDLLPERTCGIAKVRRRFEENAKCWDEFEYKKIRVFHTHLADTFLVECDGEGTLISPQFRDSHPYRNYYFILFKLRNGKICELRQFSNPMKLLHDYWRIMPNRCA